MKALLYTLLVLLILGGICVITCPDKEDHSEALKNMINKAMTEELAKDSGDEDEAGLSMLGSMLGKGIAGLVIDNMLEVNNYFVCSIGTVTYEGETRVVSVGLLNHVFTANAKKAFEKEMAGN